MKVSAAEAEEQELHERLQYEQALREWKRASALVVLSFVTLLLTVIVLALALTGRQPPDVVGIMMLVSIFSGFMATWVYGIYVTATARAWTWVILCAIPISLVPAALFYGWMRRREAAGIVFAEDSARFRTRN